METAEPGDEIFKLWKEWDEPLSQSSYKGLIEIAVTRGHIFDMQ